MDYGEKYLSQVKMKILQLSAGIKGEIFLFGSRASCSNGKYSDIDIGFKGMDKEVFSKLERDFIEYLEDSIIPYEVDLVYFPEVSEGFRKIAEKEKLIWKEN